MIIGRYSVNPLEVLYGEIKWEPDIPTYIVTIVIEDDGSIMTHLSQYVAKEDGAIKLLKLIDKCIEEKKEAQLENMGDVWEDDE